MTTNALMDLAERLEGALRMLRERGKRTEHQKFSGKADLLLANELEPLFREAATQLRTAAAEGKGP